MFHGQKRVHKDGIAFAVNECDRIGDPSQIFLARWKALSRAPAFLSQKLPIQLGAGWPGLSTVDTIHTEAAPLSAIFGGRGFLRRAVRLFRLNSHSQSGHLAAHPTLRGLPQIEAQAASNRNAREIGEDALCESIPE